MWSATGMLMTAVNICYGEEEKRGFLSFNLHALALGAGLALFGAAALALVAVLPAAFAILPVPEALDNVLGLVRWPILAAIVILALAIIYRYAPNRTEPKWQSSTLTMRPMPNLVVGLWTSACSHVAMSLTASGGNTPYMAVICRSTMFGSATRP
jgi:hypothetical protein